MNNDLINKNTKKLLLAIIKSALGLSNDKILISSSEIPLIETIATRQSILYIVISGLKNIERSDLLTDTMILYESKAIYDYTQRSDSLNKVSTVLNEACIPYIPLKGSVLWSLYPQPQMRTSSDIDVLVHESDLETTIKAIEQKTTFKYYKQAHHDAHFINNRVHLELHFSLKSNLEKMDCVLDDAWNYTKKDEIGTKFNFSPEYLIFYNVSHAAKHLIKQGGIGIRPMIDLWLLRTKTEYDEAEVRILCEKADILGYYETCCSLLAAWFEDVPYTDTVQRFEDLVFSGGVFGSQHNKILSRGRKNRGYKYYFSRVFKKNRELKEIYPVCNEHPILLPLYQVKRWGTVFRPAVRKELKSELSQARKIDPEEIKEYDELMRKIGL